MINVAPQRYDVSFPYDVTGGTQEITFIKIITNKIIIKIYIN